MRRPRIREIVPADDDFALSVTWEDGSRSQVSLAGPVHRLKLFAPLRDPDTFRRVRIADWGWAIEWPGGLDYSADSLWRLSQEQARKTPGPDGGGPDLGRPQGSGPWSVQPGPSLAGAVARRGGPA